MIFEGLREEMEQIDRDARIPKWVWFAVAGLVAVMTISIAAWAQEPAAMPIIPDNAITPGVVASTNETEVCGRTASGQTYSQAHRKTTMEMKHEAFERYGIPYPPASERSKWEIDHRLELSLGGADDIRNLWPQPSLKLGVQWGREQKDKLELLAWERVCKFHNMSLADAQKLFIAPADWRVAYCGMIGGSPCSVLAKQSE